MKPADLALLEERIGYCFADRSILVRALTHLSYEYEQPSAAAEAEPAGNAQMEFLGDAVLGFVVAARLVELFPAYREGRLTVLKNRLVSAVHLHTVAREIDLGAYLLLGRSEEMSGGRAKQTLLADALEALIAGIYLDGGVEAARSFVTRIVVPGEGFGDDPASALGPSLDFKTALQELAHARRLPLPHYVIVDERLAGHVKVFRAEVKIGKEWRGSGEGTSKKSAAQCAARELYERLAASAPGES